MRQIITEKIAGKWQECFCSLGIAWGKEGYVKRKRKGD